MGLFSPPASPALPALPDAPASPPVFGQNPVQQKPQSKGMIPSVLGTGSAPTSGQRGTKTLLGS